MTTQNKLSELEFQNKSVQLVARIIAVLGILFLFLVSLNMMSGAFKLFGKETAQCIIGVTQNPFVGLFIGLLATALVQSSSTTTSMVVAIVAAGTLPLQTAIPLIMGANIGTSVTSTIVSMGHITNRNEFKKAIAAATVHDFFNIIVTLILFPLEVYFHVLSGSAVFITELFNITGTGSGEKMFSIMGVTVKPTAKWIIGLLGKKALVVLLVSMVMLFFALRYLSKVLKSILIGKSQEKMEQAVFGSPVKAVLWGTGITAAVQSSSVTTSLTVPLVATDKLSLKKAFPFLLGANIGTTVTALIAAISKTDDAINVAVCHVLFNLLGVILFMLIPLVRSIPVDLATKLGELTLKNRLIGFGYILVVFFLIPFLLIYFTGVGTC
ncbi:MAG: Na/Pi symporter [Cyclobacteriaceae bacterium]